MSSIRRTLTPARYICLATLVAFDDLGLEGQLAELGHLQLDLAGLGLQTTGVGPGVRIDAVGGALVSLGAAELVGLGVQQHVEGLFDGPADLFVEVAVDPLGIDVQGAGKRLGSDSVTGGRLVRSDTVVSCFWVCRR